MGAKIAVFDLDGTLVDTAPDLLDSLNHTLLETGVGPVPGAGFNTVVGHGGRAMIAKAFAGARKDLAKDAHERLFQLFIDHYGANIPGRSQQFPGVVAALDRVLDYYARHEPSSPVPLLVGRAKRLVSMSFFEAIKELAPSGLKELQTLAGSGDEAKR